MMDRRPQLIGSPVFTANGQTPLTIDFGQALVESGFDWVCIQSSGTFVLTVTVEVSNDGVTYFAIPNGWDLTAPSTAISTITTTGKLIFFPCTTRYMRFRSSAYTSGSATLTVVGGYGPTTYAQNALPINVTYSPSSTVGGYPSSHHLVSAASTNSTLVKAQAAVLGDLIATNTSASMKFLKIYNKATAPTVGTDTPIKTIGIPATGTVTWAQANGHRTSLGLGIGITGAAAVADTTAVAVGDVISNITYA